MNENKEIAVVYMVAGLSSRFGGKIKQFAQVGPNNETLIELSMTQALKAGFTKIIFIVGNLTSLPFKEKFNNAFQNFPILYALQSYNEKERDKPWGTADALCSALNLIDCPFVVCNGDDIYGESSFKLLFNHLINSNDDKEASLAYLLSSVLPKEGKTNRAIFHINSSNNDKNKVIEIKEYLNISNENLSSLNLSASNICSMNIFALHPSTLFKIKSRVENFKNLHKGDRKIECLLPEELSQLIKNKDINMQVYPAVNRWIGITNPEDEITVKNALKERYKEQ